MRSIHIVPLLFHLAFSANPNDHQYAESDAIQTDGILNALHNEFTKVTNGEPLRSERRKKRIFHNDFTDEELKQEWNAVQPSKIQALNKVIGNVNTVGSLIKRGGSLSIPYVLHRKEILIDIYRAAAQRGRERSLRRDRLRDIYKLAAETARAKSSNTITGEGQISHGG